MKSLKFNEKKRRARAPGKKEFNFKLYRVYATLLFTLLFILPGCWDIREINDLGFVTAVGIDKAKAPNKFNVTVQIANANTASAKSEQGQTQSGVWTGTGEGPSLFAAIRNLIRISSRRVMWAHNNVIIIGEDLAKDSIAPVADFFTHNPELRMKTPVVVSRGPAKDYITAKAGMETPSGLSFVYFRDYGSLLGETVQSSMLTLSTALANPYVQPLIAAVSLKKAEEPPEEGGGKSDSEKESKTIDLAGAAVFRGDKMVGWLTPKETLGLAWIKNQTNNTIVTVIDPTRHNRSVAVETKGVKAEIMTKMLGTMPQVTMKITGGANIVEEDGPPSQGLNRVKKQLASLLNRHIAGNIKSSLKKIQQEYKSDVIGLAPIVHTEHNREWEKGLKNKWKEIFPQIPVEVRVKIQIYSNTLKQLPAKVYK
ncbi:MAG TPA: Ger(x)C family spore germination protein [Bacillota bacterium]|nr:Ger(x)C family spore germination protein [Bacillota bacterium]